jgi:hypothetical protein
VGFDQSEGLKPFSGSSHFLTKCQHGHQLKLVQSTPEAAELVGSANMESGKCNAPCQEASGRSTGEVQRAGSVRLSASRMFAARAVISQHAMTHNDLHGLSLLEPLYPSPCERFYRRSSFLPEQGSQHLTNTIKRVKFSRGHHPMKSSPDRIRF